ncbi:MAG: CoA transferase [Pseudoxanthomonas sp.]
MSGDILSGLRVVEASAFVAAPLGGMTLAQMGADVIRIDALGGGLDYRRWPVTEDDVSLFWCGLNKSKRSVALDLASPEGRELAIAIIAAPGEDGGLLLTNFPARGWLDYAKLQALRSDLIQLTVQGDRNGGSAVDYTVNPRVGLPYLTGSGSDEVVNHVLPAWDLITGQMAAVGLLAAERHRRLTGEGQQVTLALEDVALATMGHLGFIAEAQLGHKRERGGNFLFGAFGRDFVCADGQRVMVVGLTGKQWRALCEATDMGGEVAALAQHLAVDLSREGERFKAREALADLFGNWIGARRFAEVADAFDKHGVCWSRYQHVDELVRNDPACSPENPMFSIVQQAGVGPVLAPGIPLAFQKSPRGPARPAPRLGEHTEQVLCDLVGLSSVEFARLHDRGIVAVTG